MDWIAISFFGYTLVVMAFGVYSARFSQQTSADFFLADRKLGAWVAALSAAASAESGWVTLGLVGIAYKTGIGVIWLVFGTVAAFLFNWLVLAKPLREHSVRAEGLTLPDVLAAKHSGAAATAIRVIGAAIILAMLTAYVAAQLNAAGKAFEETFQWQYVIGVGIGGAIVLIYTIVGGFRAVAWTDVVQAVLMIGGVLVLPLAMLVQIGGLGEFWRQLQALEPQEISTGGRTIALAGGATMTSFFAGKTGLALVGFLAVWLGIPLGNFGQPHILVRLMAARDETAIRRAAIISTVWVGCLFCGAILVGLTARVLFGNSLTDPERALPHAAVQLLPAPLAGLMIAAVVAAMCSTADSQLLVCASAASHDLYARLTERELSERARTRINRGAVLAVALLATIIAMTKVRAVFSFVLYAWDALGAAFGPALIFSLLWRRTSGWGVVAGMLVGVSNAILWRETLHAQLYSLIPAFTLAAVAIVVVSLATAKTDAASGRA